jgi:hypothetical protein
VLVGVVLIALAATDFRLFRGDDKRTPPAQAATEFDVGRVLAGARRQVAFGPRPAGSAALRRLAVQLRAQLPAGRFEPLPGGLRNIVGTLPGRRPAILVAAHYDTEDLPGFVGANDGAVGAATVIELARGLAADRPRNSREVRFALFDGEEAARGTPDSEFVRFGLRGSKVYAREHARELRSMILIDFIGNRSLTIPRERGSDPALWRLLRESARAVGAEGAFPDRSAVRIFDDHLPFTALGVPAVDLIDFHYPCYHRRCDTLAQVSADSVRKAGSAVAQLVRRLEAAR